MKQEVYKPLLDGSKTKKELETEICGQNTNLDSLATIFQAELIAIELGANKV